MGIKITFHDNGTYYFVIAPKSFFHSKAFVTKSDKPFPRTSTSIKILNITAVPWWETAPDFLRILKAKLKKYFAKKCICRFIRAEKESGNVPEKGDLAELIKALAELVSARKGFL